MIPNGPGICPPNGPGIRPPNGPGIRPSDRPWRPTQPVVSLNK